MKKIFFLFILFFYKLIAADFISSEEYQLSLYQNPRGIGCDKCHGKDGKESIFASYLQNGEKKQIIIPNIQNITFEKLNKRLSQKSSARSIMPTYFLTQKEIQNLYLYLNNIKKDKK